MYYSELNNEFAKKFAELTNTAEMTLPEGILFEFDREKQNQINIVIGKKAATKNMQDDSAAFEGWILAIISKLKGYTVYLDANEEFEKYGKKEVGGKEQYRGTYNRCLYRLNRFCNQFSKIVELSSSLKNLSKTIYVNGQYKDMSSTELVVNRPEGNAGVNQNPEILIEALFSKFPKSLIRQTEKNINKKIDGELHRQLPVGIFEKDNKERDLKGEKVFTAGHAAIDLWCISEDCEDICIYELKKLSDKKSKNNKVGIVSELYFYSNLIYDLYCVQNNFSVSGGSATGRGFEKIIDSNTRIKKVHAFFLVEELHKEINNVIPLLNQNTPIDYNLLQYELRVF